MALHVDFKSRFGYFIRKSADGKHSCKVHFCDANALTAMMHFYREEQDGKREDMVQLWGFFADLKHAERCLKDESLFFFRHCVNFTFYAKAIAEHPDMWKFIKLLTKYGIKVTIK